MMMTYNIKYTVCTVQMKNTWLRLLFYRGTERTEKQSTKPFFFDLLFFSGLKHPNTQ